MVQKTTKKLRAEECAITIHRRTNSTSSDLVYTGKIVSGWNEDFTALWNEAMDEANLREEHLLVVDCGTSPSGAAGDEWSGIKGSQSVRTISARFGKTVIGPCYY